MLTVMVQSIAQCVILLIILLSQSSWYTLVMTTYKKELPAARFLHVQKNADTEQHRHTIMSLVGFKATIHMRILLS
jgi:hypothetical protein